MTDSAATSTSTSTQFAFLPFLPASLQDAAAALSPVPVGLARLGCDTFRQRVVRQVDHLRDLGQVSDLSGLLDCQARFARTLWDDQQRAIEQALQILGLGGDATPVEPARPAAASKPSSAASKPSEAAPKPSAAAPNEPTTRQVAGAEADEAAEADVPVARKPSGRKRSGRSKRSEKKTEKSSETASYEIFLDKDGDHRFRLKGEDGTVLLVSKPYKSRTSAVNGIEVVRRNAANDDRYVTAEDPKGDRTFDLRAGNSRVISSSTPFPSAAKMRAAMAMVKRVAGSARIETD